MASIRAQLSATLTGVHSLSSHTNISKSISQTAPDLAEAFADRNVGGVDGLADVDVFGDETGRNVGPSLKELEMAVEERKHARPEGIQRQVPPYRRAHVLTQSHPVLRRSKKMHYSVPHACERRSALPHEY